MLPSSPTFLLSGNLSLSECEPLHRTHDMIPAFLLECVIPNREREIEREGERERERRRTRTRTTRTKTRRTRRRRPQCLL